MKKIIEMWRKLKTAAAAKYRGEKAKISWRNGVKYRILWRNINEMKMQRRKRRNRIISSSAACLAKIYRIWRRIGYHVKA
jgi:hypothetical protein